MNDESLYIYGATLMMVIGTFSCRELPLLLLRVQHLAEIHPHRHLRRFDLPGYFPERQRAELHTAKLRFVGHCLRLPHRV